MARMRETTDEVDEEAPTTVFEPRPEGARRPGRRSDPPQRLMLSPNDAARLLKVNRKTIHSLLAQGLPHQRLGPRIIRIRSSDLLAWGVKNALSGGK
jgi:excisionase family DNA binding protein